MMADEFVLTEHEGGDDPDRPAWVAIPDETHLLAEVQKAGIVIKPFKDDDGNEIKKVEFTFEIIEEGDYFGRKVKGETPLTFTTHPDCKLRNWMQEILKQDLPVGFKVNLDILEGAIVDVTVKAKESPRKDGNGNWTRQWVSDIRRYVEDPSAVSPSALDDEPF